ncbi:putative major facilitator, sugar transporter, major facilitator superfamily [Dioscorea sansibarensis]
MSMANRKDREIGVSIANLGDHDDARESLISKGKESVGMVLLSTFVAVCGSFEFGSCIGFSAPAQADIRKDLDLSLSEYGLFGSLMNIAAMIGAVASGPTSDFIGRKGAMRASAVICIIGWLAIYFAQGAILLDLGRFATGYGIGVLSYVVPIFIAEIAPKNIRGALTTLHQLMIVVGIAVAFIIGALVSWQTLALTGIVPCVVLLVGLFFIPESPRWLAKVGRHKEFEDACQILRGKDADISAEVQEIQEYIDNLENLPKGRVQDLFQWIYMRPVIVGVGLMVFQQFGGVNGIIFYSSETFATAGFSSARLGTVLLGLTQVPVTILGAIFLDRTGRRPLLLISASGTFLGTFQAGLSFYFRDHNMYTDWAPILAVSGMMTYLGSFSIGMGAIPWVIMSEIFPINIKGVAGSLVTLVNWFGSWFTSYSFNFLMSWNSAGTFFIYAIVNAVTVVFVAKMVPETKGRTLEEIHASMNPRK